jgi:hypothetical protein
MSKKLTIVCVAVFALGALTVRPAQAHFILLKPDSWLNEDQSPLAGGAPQKMGPCGPGGGDDVQPVPESGKMTTVHVGDKVMVQWQVTVPHGGYFRISLAKDRSEFTEPHFADDVACSFDAMSVQTGAHGNVLMDGIDSGATEQEITIPDMPCDECTLQVIQVMQDHGPPNCTYYHCANLQILGADGGGTGGTGGDAGQGGSTGGTGAAGMGGGGSGGTGGGMSTGSGGMSGASTGSGGAPSGMSTGSGGMTAGSTGTGGAVAMPGSGGAPAMTGTGGSSLVVQQPSSKSDSGGCAVSEPGARDARTALWLAIGFGWVAMQRRLRRRR